MKREFKPGDVAMVDVSHLDEPRIMLRDDTGWADREATFYWDKAQDGWTITDVRPLVVIDPEDREQVRQVLETYGRQFTSWAPELDHNVTRLQEALRSLITPPKPEEPTGLGAVVEDAEGDKWILVYDEEGDGRAWARVGIVSVLEAWRAYADVAAIKVLSEGVTP